MKAKWEYKRLGDLCEVLDSKRKPITKCNRRLGTVPYYGATGIQDYVDGFIFDGRYLLVGEDGAKWGKNDNSAYIIEGKAWVNNHAHILKLHNDVDDTFVRYYLNGKDLTSYITGAVVPKLTQASLASIPIPVPPLDEQQRIVAELDLLTGIIDKQKAQLKELDTLAQSIFYDMFGDPIHNEKGWDLKKLGEICDSITDGDHMPPPKSESGVPFLTISDIDKEKRQLIFENTFFVPQSYFDSLKDNRKARVGDLLYTVTGSYGIPVVVSENRDFCFQRHIALIKPQKKFLSTIFLCFWALCKSVKLMVDGFATGIAQKTVGLGSIRKLPFILPPLALQQSFAEKIQSIEKQKETIRASIADTQKLLDYTMDKYFG